MAALSLTPGDILAENGLLEEPNCLFGEQERKRLLQRAQRRGERRRETQEHRPFEAQGKQE
jgi:hypothetical protein